MDLMLDSVFLATKITAFFVQRYFRMPSAVGTIKKEHQKN